MATSIDPTAVISSSAQLGTNVTVGPYCIIGDNVLIGDSVRLYSHVVLDGHTSIGEGCEIFPFAVLGCGRNTYSMIMSHQADHRQKMRYPGTCNNASWNGD